MRHAVIMAGGAGVRLWPLSRRSRPKPIIPLFGGKSLLRQSYERVATVLPPAHIHVITSRALEPVVSEQLPELPAANFIGEPVGRDTAAAVGLACAVLAGRDPQAVVGIFTADHVITPMDRFSAGVDRAYRTAEQYPDALVTMGIRPTRADTNYGYIHRGRRVDNGLYEAGEFKEKPDATTAERYRSSGEYYWNSGMFVWRADTILHELKEHLPRSHAAIRRIAEAWNTAQRGAVLDNLYPALEKISIDFAVMEKARHVLVVELDCDWLDLGSWAALASVIGADDDGNVSSCRRAVHSRSRGNIVVAEEDHLIATMGVEDLVIVHSRDATLVCRKDEAAGLKDLVEKVARECGDEYV